MGRHSGIIRTIIWHRFYPECRGFAAPLATPLTTAIFVSFFFFSWQEMRLLRRGTAVFLHGHNKRETFSDAHFNFTSAPGGKGTGAKMSFSRTTVNCGLIRCQSKLSKITPSSGWALCNYRILERVELSIVLKENRLLSMVLKSVSGWSNLQNKGVVILWNPQFCTK